MWLNLWNIIKVNRWNLYHEGYDAFSIQAALVYNCKIYAMESINSISWSDIMVDIVSRIMDKHWLICVL